MKVLSSAQISSTISAFTERTFYPHMPIGKVWIYCSLFVVFLFLFVCTVTDFSGEDKASGVKFCTEVYRLPWMDSESPILGTLLLGFGATSINIWPFLFWLYSLLYNSAYYQISRDKK